MKKYYPALDSVRFFAWLAVFISHCVVFVFRTHYELAIGDLGVALFFVLSGFLITRLLLEEQDRTGSIQLPRFYGKRVRRIWPLYFLTLAIGFVWLRFAPQLSGIPGSAAPLWQFLFLGNLALIQTPTLTPILAVLWSVSVEEQFYLLWPLFVRGARKWIAAILALVCVISAGNRALFYDDPGVLAYATFSVMGYLALGGFAAIAFAQDTVCERLAKHASKIALVCGIAIAALLAMRIALVSRGAFETRFAAGVFPLFFGIAFSVLILSLASIPSPNSVFSKITAYLGKISYGLYCYHTIALLAMLLVFDRTSAPTRFLVVVSSFTFSIGVAALSYRYFERPIMRLRRAEAEKVGF
jgi:peptidoglycan/LPS O-acetylase OafA/YrhL